MALTSNQSVGATASDSIENLIKTLIQQQSDATASRGSVISSMQALLGEYNKQKAIADSQALIDLSLQKSAEQTMPSLQKAIQGAGTSAGSMQALLAQRAQRDAALTAGALGANQVVQYGDISKNIGAVIEALTRTSDINSVLAQLLGSQSKQDAEAGGVGTKAGQIWPDFWSGGNSAASMLGNDRLQRRTYASQFE